MGQPGQARPPGSACVWAVAAVLFLAVLAGGGCLVLYVTLPPAESPGWLPAAALTLVAFPWAFWIATCAYRCCCSFPRPDTGAAPAGNAVERQASRPAAVAPMPSSKTLKSALSKKHDRPAGAGGARRRVRFGDSTVLGEEEAAAAAGDEKDEASSVTSHESEEPFADSTQSS